MEHGAWSNKDVNNLTQNEELYRTGMRTSSIFTTFTLITVLTFTVLIGWFTISEGMFFDGILYAAVANHIANDVGSFWHLTYTQTLHTEYYEQPPFVFLLQSWFFRLLGDGTYPERIYCLVMAILTALMIGKTWRSIFPMHRQLSWLPVLIWLLFPIVNWTYQNNLMEVTMGLFDVLAVYFLVQGMRKDNAWWIFLGSGCIFLASFCKGIQGLFPVVLPFGYWLFIEKMTLSKLAVRIMLTVSIPIVVYTAFLYWPEAITYYEQYFQRRLAGTFAGFQDTTGNHFFLLYKLLLELIFPLFLFLIVFLIGRKKSNQPSWSWMKLFLFIGLCGSLPLLITLEQRPFYLATAMPFFALSLAAWTGDYFKQLLNSIAIQSATLVRINQFILVLCCICVLVLPFWHHYTKRDHAILSDIEKIKSIESLPSMVTILPPMADDWAIHAYFIRYLGISLDSRGNHPHMLALQGDNVESPCTEITELNLQYFRLFTCPAE